MIKLILILFISIRLIKFKSIKFSKSIIIFCASRYILTILLYYSRNIWIGGGLFFIDYYSYILVILSLWIRGCILIINIADLIELIVLGLINLLILCFFSINLIIFYLIFEASLLPIFFLILYGGYAYERYEAAIYIIIYTAVSSVPFIWVLIILFFEYKRLIIIILIFLNLKLDRVIFFLCLIGFIVKLPTFLFHIWLPKAHVEAPVYGSIILAGVLLKLGRYGILRMVQIFRYNTIQWRHIIITLGVIGGILIRLLCLIQVDIKILVAYSSIVHIRLLIRGIVTLTKVGLIGGLIIMLAHGLCSSGLFYIVNINYECFGRRLIYLNKGSISINPSLRLIWFLICSSNLSAPVSLNLIREIFLLIGLIRWRVRVIGILIVICFLRATYSLYLFRLRQHGERLVLQMNYKNVFVKDYFILILHWIPLNFLFLRIGIFIM